jgi:hypothetical protein
MKKEEQVEIDFHGHLKHIEDVADVELPRDDKTLTDSELEQAGLVKTSAFVRTKKSKNALRIEKHKAKKAELGVKQLNIEVPEEHRDTFKALAKELTSNGTIKQDKLDYLAKLVVVDNDTKANEKKASQKAHTDEKQHLNDEHIAIGKKCAEIALRGGFKSFMLKVLIK